jgi:hypothetical protein
MKNTLSTVNKYAHAIKKETGCTWADAMRKAWQVAKLKNRLAKGETSFFFIKADGTERTAKGTTCSNLFNYESKGAERKENPLNVAYFDLEAGAFRSFNVLRLQH